MSTLLLFLIAVVPIDKNTILGSPVFYQCATAFITQSASCDGILICNDVALVEYTPAQDDNPETYIIYCDDVVYRNGFE